MKYICHNCGKLMDEVEVFARDAIGYLCSEECYKELYPDDASECADESESIEEISEVSEIVEFRSPIDLARTMIDSVAKKVYGETAFLDKKDNVVKTTKKIISSVATAISGLFFLAAFLALLIMNLFVLSFETIGIYATISIICSLLVGIIWGKLVEETTVYQYLGLVETGDFSKKTIVSIDSNDDDYDNTFFKVLKEEAERV